MELAEAYISIGAYRFGAFCVEELVLLNPMDSFLHNRLADVSSNCLWIALDFYSHRIY